MKKIISLGIVLICGVVLVGCGNVAKNSTEKSNKNESSASKETIVASETKEKTNDNAESTEIFAPGDYIVGEDLKAGSYYAVLTEMETKKDDAENKESIDMKIYEKNKDQGKTDDSGIIDNDEFNYLNSNEFENVGNKYKVSLKDGQKVTFINGIYEPESFTIKLLTNDDFKEYMSKKENNLESSSK